MESILPPWFSDSIGSKVSLVKGSPLGSSQCRLAFGSASSPGVLGDFLSLSYCTSELLSVDSRPASSVFFFFSLLLFEIALFLVEPSDSFGSKGYPYRRGRPLGQCASLCPLTRSNLRVALATWSPFGTSMSFA